MTKPFFTFVALLVAFSISSTFTFSQDFTIVQNVTGNNRSDIRGQVFKPSAPGSGTGTITSSGAVYLSSFEVIYADGTEASTLYIYSTPPSSVASLESGSGGTLVGASVSKSEDFPYAVYHFDNLELDKNTAYYALFRQNVQLEFGASGSAAGPYSGGKMIVNSSGSLLENNFTALKFIARLQNQSEPHEGDLNALKAFHSSTNGANWTNKWDLSGDPYTWNGVVWSGSRVTQLDMNNNNVTGTMPAEIGNLTELTSLWLTNNAITGSIPSTIGNLTKVTYLNLFNNLLTGSIPPEIGDMEKLESLSFGRNKLSGSIPAELGDLANLSFVSFELNDLTGEIPPSLGNLTEMKILYLQNNRFTGGLPASFQNMTKLEQLYAGGVPMQTIPSWIFSRTTLTRLYLSNTGLTGEIPTGLFNLVNLIELDLNGNSLSGSLPSGIGNLNKLQRLYLYRNELSGSLPGSMTNLTELQDLLIYTNKFTGTLPSFIKNLKKLQQLNISENQFDGSLPTELGDMESMENLYLGSNKFTGTIPASIGNLTHLTTLLVEGNQLSGTIPAAIVNAPLSTINLSKNRYDFATFEAATFLSTILNVVKGPQSKIPVANENMVIPLGSKLTLTLQTPGQNNRYEWLRGGISVSSASESPIFEIADFKTSDFGSYYCKVTNTVVPDLILETVPVLVTYQIGFNTGSPSLTEAKALSATVNLNVNKPGKVYYVALPASVVALTPQQVLEGKDAAGNSVATSGSADVMMNLQKQISITGLQPGTLYSVYFVAQEPSSISSVAVLGVQTADAIKFATGYPKAADIKETTIKFEAMTTKPGALYYVPLPAGETAPTADNIVQGKNSQGQAANSAGHGDVTAATASTFEITGLDDETAYKIYIVAKDQENLVSPIAVLETTTITGLEDALASNFTAYPNPVHASFTVTDPSCDPCQITVVDLAGRNVLTNKNYRSHETIDFHSPAKGIYLVHITTPLQHKWIKISKE